MADGNGGLWPEFLVVAGKERSWRSSKGLARRIVKDLTMNWPPNLRPFTSELGLKEKSEADLVVWSFGCWCFCFFLFFLLFFVSVSSMFCSSLRPSFFSFVVGFVVSAYSMIKKPIFCFSGYNRLCSVSFIWLPLLQEFLLFIKRKLSFHFPQIEPKVLIFH